MEILKVRISGSGIARNGMDALKRRSSLYDAKAAISALHDGLLAVAKGDITPDQVRDFFWKGDEIKEAQFFGDVLSFEKTAEEPADG
jgi:hypothetical protein